MRSLLTYSGLSAKVRAMKGRLISFRQFQELCLLETVQAAGDYLKRLPAYEALFADIDESRLHRANLEHLLVISLYQDFSRLYRFSNQNQRKFLDLYFLHYEIAMVKRCLRAVLGHQEVESDLAITQDFFNHHSRLDPLKLISSADLREFIANLDGTPYRSLLNQLGETGNLTVFDYEMKLDLLYFQTIWKATGKLLTKAEQELLAECFGAKLDLLNIQWIYRSKKYYNLSEVDIYALLIPFNHQLKSGQIKRLVESRTMEEFFASLRATRYSGRDLGEQGQFGPEDLSRAILGRIHTVSSRKNPYSIAALSSYLYFKEEEIRKVIIIIESIRYGIGGDEIFSHVMK